MGNKIMSLVARPFRNYNIEARAHKVISQDKPTPAPKHKTDVIEYERIMREYPEVLQESLKKNEELDSRLKDVYVVSQLDNPVITKQTPDKPLPLDRSPVPVFEFGYREPDTKAVIRGKVTLKQALQFITNFQSDPKRCSRQHISDTYLLPEETVNNVLKFFKVYEVYEPTKPMKGMFAGPSLPRVKVQRRKTPELLPKKNDSESGKS